MLRAAIGVAACVVQHFFFVPARDLEARGPVLVVSLVHPEPVAAVYVSTHPRAVVVRGAVHGASFPPARAQPLGRDQVRVDFSLIGGFEHG